jgi:hypothetical protein
MLMFWEYQSIVIFFERPIKVAHEKIIIIEHHVHPQLINIDLQEGMVIKGI